VNKRSIAARSFDLHSGRKARDRDDRPLMRAFGYLFLLVEGLHFEEAPYSRPHAHYQIDMALLCIGELLSAHMKVQLGDEEIPES